MPTEYRSAPIGDDFNTGGSVIDPGDVDEAGTRPDEPVRQRRKRRDAGQPRGPRNSDGKAKSEKAASLDLSTLTGMLVGMHAVLAMRLDAPEFELSEEEGKEFMKAAQNVMRHYSVKATQKTIDTIALVGAGMTIYAPRIAAYTIRKRSEKAEREQPLHGVVVGFPQNGRPQ